jgi:predicted amidohydrolase YtcJ
VSDAVATFTKGVAYVNGDEDLLGTLDVGRRADVAVLSHDIFAIPASEIGQTTVDVTVAGGAVVHGDE